MCSFTYFFHCLSFLPCIGGPYKIFMFVFQQKKVSLVFFICRSRSLSTFFWLSFAGLPPLFLCLSLALYSKSVDMTINLSLKLLPTRIQKKIHLSVVILSCLYFTRRWWLCHFPPKYPRVAFGLPYLLIELFYIGLPVVRTVGRSGGVLSRDYQIF